MRAIALLLAAGRGRRLGEGRAKGFLELGGRSLIARAVDVVDGCDAIEAFVVAAPPGGEDEAKVAASSSSKVAAVVGGGDTRQESVRRALEVIPDGLDAVACHDVARPFAPPELFERVLAGLNEADGVVPAVPVPDTLKRVEARLVVESLPRDGVLAVQTPQAFRRRALEDAHAAAERDGVVATDDAALLERAGFRVVAVRGEPGNRKITVPEDLLWAETVLRDRAGGSRHGLGFDVHPRDPDRPLSLGGVAFPGEPGLAAHSDGDVVSHALCDALLGAAALGDLGQHFPEDDPDLAGIAGAELIRRTVALLEKAGFAPGSCDLTLLADRPRIAGRREEMRRTIAGALGIGNDRVSVKATRPEGLELSGDGAACLALATIERRPSR